MTAGQTPANHLVGLDEIQAAAERLRGVARRTPLHPVALSADDGTEGSGQVWLKCESLQHAGAFKLRGAYNFVSKLGAARDAGILTYSSGNHAQGVAYAARAFGQTATVVMPVDAPGVKVDGARALGARVEQIGLTTRERQERAEEIAARTGAIIVPPFDHPAIIAGQGTVGLEISEQLRDAERRGVVRDPVPPELVLVPIGGGGLISGTAAALKALHPDVRIVGVEPAGAPAMQRSLKQGSPVTLDTIDTIADGLKPIRVGDLTFAHCHELVERVVTVRDEEIRAAVLWCFRRRLIVEPSGAATVAALLAGHVRPATRPGATVAVISGGNLDPMLLARWLSQESALVA